MPKYARWEHPAQDEEGNLLSGVWCRVRREEVPGNPYAALFSDRDGATGLSNPFFTSEDEVAFHCVGGAYMVELWTTGGFEKTLRYQAVGRGAETDWSGLAPRGLWSAATTYEIGDMVTVLVGSAYRMFGSLQDENLNHAPDSATPGDNAWWQYLGVAAQLVSTGHHVAISDETIPLVTGSGKVPIRNFGTLQVSTVRASVSEASSSGPVTVDILVNGVSMLSTKITIDQGEKTSVTAAVPPVLSTTSIPDDAEIKFNVDTAGVGVKGLKVMIAAVNQ